MASEACGVQGMSTGLAIFSPASALPYHRHDVSEAFTVLSGDALAMVEGRTYRMGPLDCLHVPAGVAHSVINPSAKKKLMIHAAFGAVHPRRDFVKDSFVSVDREWIAITVCPMRTPRSTWSESRKATRYKLANGTSFCDLFAGTLWICRNLRWLRGISARYGSAVPSS